MDFQSLVTIIGLALVVLSHVVFISQKMAKLGFSVERLLDELKTFKDVQSELSELKREIDLLKQAKELGY